MTKYIRFSNEANDVPRIRLEKMGISSKRGDENTVGQFGSGAKLAPVAAVRKGWEWICLGTDVRGNYKLEYVSKEVDGYDIVYYRYTDNIGTDNEIVTDIPSSFSLDAGVLSWDTNFQIYREAFANAFDAFTEFDAEYTIDVVDEVVFRPGYFEVYLTASDELLDIYNNQDVYFKHDAIADYVVPESSYGARGAKLYKNYYMPTENDSHEEIIFDKEPKLYGKAGIWVGDIMHEFSLFSYEYNDFTLNEERRLSQPYQVDSLITACLKNLDDMSIISEIIKIDSMDIDTISVKEFDMPSYLFNGIDSSNAWGDTFKSMYGDKCVPLCQSSSTGLFSSEIIIKLNMRNYTYKEITNEVVYDLITGSHPMIDQTVSAVLGVDADFDIVDNLPNSLQSVFDKSLKIVDAYENIPSNLDIKVFDNRGYQEKLMGIYIPPKIGADNERILLSLLTLEAGIESTVTTLIHEIDHLVTGYSDSDREFRDVADRRIGRLIMRLAEVDNV